MGRKRIVIKKHHFQFFYFLLKEEPWVIPDGREIIDFIPQGHFILLIKTEGSQAKATAINIAKKNSQLKEKEKIFTQGGGIQGKLLLPPKHGP